MKSNFPMKVAKPLPEIKPGEMYWYPDPVKGPYLMSAKQLESFKALKKMLAK